MHKIGRLNENSLHDQLKNHYLGNSDYTEIKVDGYYIDVIKDNEFIEIQTRSFSSIKRKLAKLLDKYKVKLVHPISETIMIRQYDENMKTIISERKSPKKGKLLDVVEELIYIPHLVDHPNLTFEVIMINERNIRCNDGKGSWRRKGVSKVNRELIDIVDTHTFRTIDDYKSLLPKRLPKKFTNKYLKEKKGLTTKQAGMLTNFLRKINVLEVKEKQGNAFVFELT